MTIRSFNTDEELFDAMKADERAAQEAMKAYPIKVEDLRHGDFFVSVRPDLGIVILGRVIETTEYPEDNENIIEMRQRGYVFGECFSAICTYGEVGDTHVTRIHGKISQGLFERMKANGFRHARKTN